MKLKQYTLLVICLFIQLTTKAQTLNLPESIGEHSFLKYEMEHVPELKYGKNLFWDLRDVRLISPIIGSVVKYQIVESADSLCIYSTDGRTTHYAFLRKGEYRIIQTDQNNQRLVYSPAKMIMKYPLSFEETFSSEQNMTQYYPQQFTLTHQSASENSLIGYGKLVLPDSKEIEDAYLVKTTQTCLADDSTGFYEENFTFYNKGFFFPIIESIKRYDLKTNNLVYDKTFFYQNEIPSLNKYYYEPDAVIENTSSDALNHVTKVQTNVSPVPTNNILYIDLEINTAETVNVYIQSLSGHTIKSFTWSFPSYGKYRQILYLSEYKLPSGTYLLRIDIQGETYIHKIQKIY